MTNISIEGFYHKVKSKFHKQGFSLMVSKRKNPTPKKPLNFLVAILPDGSRRYVSSMYQTTVTNSYNIDWNGKAYTFTYSDKEATIEQGHKPEPK